MFGKSFLSCYTQILHFLVPAVGSSDYQGRPLKFVVPPLASSDIN